MQVSLWHAKNSPLLTASAIRSSQVALTKWSSGTPKCTKCTHKCHLVHQSITVVHPNDWVSQSVILVHPRAFLLHQSAIKPACSRGALQLISLLSPSSIPSLLFPPVLSHHMSLSFSISNLLPMTKGGNTKSCHCHSHEHKCTEWKNYISLGAGAHLPNKKWKTRERRDRCRKRVKYRWGQEVRKWRGRRKTFYFLFFQNEFQGSSALGDVGSHGLTASDKHKLSTGRTTSQHHLLYGQRQREGRARQT